VGKGGAAECGVQQAIWFDVGRVMALPGDQPSILESRRAPADVLGHQPRILIPINGLGALRTVLAAGG